jgi:hypothetical protein
MRYIKILLLMVVALSATAVAQKPYVPDYFPSAMGTEWHYDMKSSSGYNIQLKMVVTERADASKTGYNVVRSSFVNDSETKNFYLKKPGWVYILKSETPASNYNVDYVEDKNELMNPLKIGESWKYKGKAEGSATQDWEQDWTVVGAEDVEVPAGKYKAIKVTSTSTVDGNVTKYTFWYVDRVGPVRILSEVGGMTNDMVLTKFTVPK